MILLSPNLYSPYLAYPRYNGGDINKFHILIVLLLLGKGECIFDSSKICTIFNYLPISFWAITL